ncbi:MAG TPA: carbohydrate-binding family 9-like protein [Thermoanaerobaculia bacterium]
MVPIDVLVHTTSQSRLRAVQELVVPFAHFAIEEPWNVPETCDRVKLRRATDGEAARQETTAAMYFDDEILTIVFAGVDDRVVATLLQHDAPLYKEDVVEVFLSPSRLEEYFEIEVNPLGTTFDARIESPDGVRATMKTDLAWTCEGLFAGVRRDGERFAVVIRIPFAALGRATPKEGETWRGNLFRVDRDPALGDDFLAWQPAKRTPPDFHVPAAFGILRFDRRNR